jgi:Ca-activated chloride channel family protein
MSFIWPLMLFSLVAVPPLVLLYWRLQRRRKQIAANYGTLGIVQEAGKRPLGARRHIPAVLFLLGLTILLVAMARPQAVVSVPRLQGTVILAFDVSGSMAATDLQPSRMEAAKAAARDFVLRQPSTIEIGVVAFSESGFTVQLPTFEQAEVLAAIDRLGPERGTSLARGIDASLYTIFVESRIDPEADRYSNLTPTATATPTPMPEGVYAPAVIVLLTDGENTAPPDPLEAALTAADRGVRVHTVGIGSPEGIVLEVEGFSVLTRLDEPTLQMIADVTDGSYYNAMTEEELRSIYTNLDPELVIEPEPMEITSIFAGSSVLMLLVGGALSLVWFSRFP